MANTISIRMNDDQMKAMENLFVSKGYTAKDRAICIRELVTTGKLLKNKAPKAAKVKAATPKKVVKAAPKCGLKKKTTKKKTAKRK